MGAWLFIPLGAEGCIWVSQVTPSLLFGKSSSLALFLHCRYYGDLKAALRQWQLQCRTARSPPSIRGGGGGGGGGFPVNVLNELFSIEGSALLQV